MYIDMVNWSTCKIPIMRYRGIAARYAAGNVTELDLCWRAVSELTWGTSDYLEGGAIVHVYELAVENSPMSMIFATHRDVDLHTFWGNSALRIAAYVVPQSRAGKGGRGSTAADSAGSPAALHLQSELDYVFCVQVRISGYNKVFKAKD